MTPLYALRVRFLFSRAYALALGPWSWLFHLLHLLVESTYNNFYAMSDPLDIFDENMPIKSTGRLGRDDEEYTEPDPQFAENAELMAWNRT